MVGKLGNLPQSEEELALFSEYVFIVNKVFNVQLIETLQML